MKKIFIYYVGMYLDKSSNKNELRYSKNILILWLLFLKKLEKLFLFTCIILRKITWSKVI